MSKILLAEDDVDMRRFLVKALQNAGFDVISYDNGLSAYQRLREEPFEMLLTDIVMPEMDGIETLRQLRVLDPEARVIAMSGGGNDKYPNPLTLAKELGVIATLEKPFRRQQLRDAVDRVLAREISEVRL